MFTHGLLVSLPPREIARSAVPASVFDRAALDLASASPELADAVALVESIGAHLGVALKYVLRPEMFTHGASLAWLRAELGPTRDHLALSDGTTIKVVPGLRNHVFLYGLARSADAQALRRLAQRAPELFGVFETQINTALAMKHGPRTYCPGTVVFSSNDASESGEGQLLRFLLGPFSPDDSASRILAAGPVDPPPSPFRHVAYAPLTQTSLDDPSFCRILAASLAKTMFDPTSALVLALPSARSQDETAEERLRPVLASLLHSDAPIPAAASTNLFVSTGRLSAESMRRFGEHTSLLAHESFDFWRNSPEFYAPFRSIKVIADDARHGAASLKVACAGMCGRDVEVVWTSARPERTLA
jgi:hypothetical protein